MKSKRVYMTVSLFAGLIAFVGLVPLPISRIIETGLVSVNPSYAAPVALEMPAHLVSVHVQEGQAVRAGQLIAKFDSRELAEKRSIAEAERNLKQKEQKILQEMLAGNSSSFDPARLKVELARAESDALRAQQEVSVVAEMLQKLNELRAPRDGVVMGLVKKAEVNKLFDRSYLRGEPVCMVGDPTKLRILVPVSSVDHKLLTDDLPTGGNLAVSVYVSGRTDRIFQGKIVRLPKAAAKDVPFALTDKGGGSVAVQPAGADGRQTVPVAQVYLVEVELTDPDASIVPGALVKAKIHCQWRTTGWWLQRKFAELFDLGLYQ